MLIYHYKGVNGAIGYAVLDVTKATVKEEKKENKQASEQKSKAEEPENNEE